MTEKSRGRGKFFTYLGVVDNVVKSMRRGFVHPLFCKLANPRKLLCRQGAIFGMSEQGFCESLSRTRNPTLDFCQRCQPSFAVVVVLTKAVTLFVSHLVSPVTSGASLPCKYKIGSEKWNVKRFLKKDE